MKLSIVIIGDEILLGRVTDTNSGLIARTFAEQGWTVAGVRTVGDSAADIRGAIVSSMAEADLTITTGGLGPTRDDITKGVMLDIFGGELRHDAAVEANVRRIFEQRNIPLNRLTRTQAYVPTSCRVIQNCCGTAPIMWFEQGGKVLVAMPGVPYETRTMLSEVAAAVRERFGSGSRIMHTEYTLAGISESALAEELVPFEDALPRGYKLAYLPSPGEIVLRLDADLGIDASVRSEAEYQCYATELTQRLGSRLLGCGRMTPAEILIAKVRARGYTVATAESCTGGNIAHLITAVAGCSDVMRGGVVSYANEVKEGVLGVAADAIATYGAVSEQVVEQMVQGVRSACMADCAVATSGIAGPGGGTHDKPVGTVWIAAATPEQAAARCYHFDGDRQAVIDRASAAALMLLAGLL